MVDIVERQRFQTKNRISLILLDSTLETALKEFIVHRQDLFPPARYDDTEIAKLFSRRHLVTEAILRKRPGQRSLIDTASHYYLILIKLINARVTAYVTDSGIKNYRITVERQSVGLQSAPPVPPQLVAALSATGSIISSFLRHL